MFHKIKYSVTFPSTGRTLAQDLDLEKGFWTIVGPNESGKSFIFEMLRFSLFGTAALRGSAEDYKTLNVVCEFSIRGVRYTVERTMKKATLYRGEEPLASGVSVVNEKIFQLLGYGMLVFDMAHSINQGEVERLGNLKPSERKRMVDQVLGIDALDVVAKWGMEEARLLERDAEAMSSGLSEPTMPQAPEGYKPTSQIDLTKLSAEAHELTMIEGFLQVGRVAPVEPECEVTQTVAELTPLAERHKALRLEVANLTTKVEVLPETVEFSTEELNQFEKDWEAYNAYATAQEWLKFNPRLTYQIQALDIFEDDYKVLDWISEKSKLETRIASLKQKGSKPCPHCGEEILLEQDAVKELEGKVAEIDAKLPKVEIKTPPVGRGEIERLKAQARAFDADKHAQMMAVPAATKPELNMAQIDRERGKASQVLERIRLVAQLVKVGEEYAQMDDYESMILTRSHYEKALATYMDARLEYERWLAERTAKQARASELAGARERHAEAQAAWVAARDYEQAFKRFETDYDTYVTRKGEIDCLRAEAEKYRKVRQLMDVLRSLIKQHVLPSLNTVASHLLRGMTGGQRNNIWVDEDFNVIVDSQALDTLSGSGKACANLALRIGLGQVLTNRVMSVLMADEIDGSMDDFRAEKTSDVLYTLENSISQVLLVSHKNIDVANTIQLGGINGHEPTPHGGND